MISEDPRRQDNWLAYSEAICNECTEPHEAATAHEQLRQLKYKGDIKAYVTVFKTLNRVAGSNGEGLQHIVNEALPHEIIDVRFYQNPRPLTSDQDFLTATYEAGRPVEPLKALKTEISSAPNPKPKETGRKNGKNPTSTTATAPAPASGKRCGDPNCWPTGEVAFRGVPQEEVNAHKKAGKNCLRCGMDGHTVHTCWARRTTEGTDLTPAPWKSSAVMQRPEGRRPREKRPREEDDSETPAPKQQKISAVETM
jgi:hypothetical protein